MKKKIDRGAWFLKILLLSGSLIAVLLTMDQLRHKNLQIRAFTDAAATSKSVAR